MKKALSVLLIATLICLTLLAVSVNSSAAENQSRIVGWADYYYDITWTAQKTIPGWHGGSSHTMVAGTVYHIPYAQPIDSGKYIGYGVSVEDFLTAAADVNSIFYTRTSSYGNTYSTYYGMDCSAFVSSCWGISRHTTYSIPLDTEGLGSLGSDTIDRLALGDALNSRSVGHVVLVTDIEYADGKVSKVEITEETPPQLRRTVYTRAALISKYSAYTIQRYTGTVPAPPSGYGAVTEPSVAPTQAPETAPPRLMGDADGDGDITILDATTIQRSILSIEVAFFDQAAADVDADDEVTIIDATLIQRWLLNIGDPLELGSPLPRDNG